MATAYVSMGAVGVYSRNGGVDILRGAIRTETVSTSGTAASGALTANSGEAAQVFCATAVYASAKGTASPTNGVYVPAGIPIPIGLDAGDTISLIDV